MEISKFIKRSYDEETWNEVKEDFTDEKLKSLQKKYQIMMQESGDIFLIISPNGTIKFISKSIFNYKTEYAKGKSIFELYQGSELEKLTKMIQSAKNNFDSVVSGDIAYVDISGKVINLEVKAKNLLNNPVIQGIFINFRNITDRVKIENKIINMASYDELTGLPNNNFFINKLKHQCQQSDISHTKFALVMLDIDGLKNINYSLGYEYGNDIVIQMVKRLRELFENTFISRCSDDRFAIILQELFYEEYEDKAKGIINILTKPYIIDKYELNISINVGICFYPDCSKEPDMLRKLAKVTLLRAKKDGKNKFKFYSTGLNIQNYKELMIRNDFHHAIDNNEFKVYYQPILNLKTNQIIAAEALARWEHPDWGILSPNEFIPLAEETGLIIEIGKMILREVCHNYKKWLNDGCPNIKISVNFSSVQFFENNFVDNIISIINEYDLNPHFLSMEITESILMKDTEKVISDLKKLKSFGIQIALDDFGTGFSSLSYLNCFSIDILKIDGSFIKNIITDNTSNIITKTIINLVHELKIKLVAEGIETLEQLEVLREMNCYAGQGYLYSRPLLLEEFEEILIKGIQKPELINNTPIVPKENRRKYFRVTFHHLLEADMTLLNINGKSVNLGSTKVLIKDIGPGGLCFLSNLRLPFEKKVTLMFSTILMGKEIKVYGHPVRLKESDNINEYGVEFTIYRSDRVKLIKLLDNVKFNMRINLLFADGRFITKTAEDYFK